LREYDETIVEPDDEEVIADEAEDEFSAYFKQGLQPKILITTSMNPSSKIYPFIEDLLMIFPETHYYKRGTYAIKSIVEYAKNRNFTDIMIINEDNKEIHSMYVIHLPDGPTAFFRITSIVHSKKIRNRAKPTAHKPELILNNFSTRLGHTIGRMFASLLPQDPNFKGRRVVTFHNQRDFIFFRHHRYIFEKDKKARLQEIGPRFTLKLKNLQLGTFDPKYAEYIWVYKKETDTSRKKFYL